MRMPLVALVTAVLASLGLGGCKSRDWPTYRFNSFRGANQPAATPLSDPTQVPSLAVQWTFPATGSAEGSFYGSPIVVNGRVFIGSSGGRFYALDAASGTLLWQFPPATQPPLLGSCAGGGDPQTFGRYGVM